MEEKDREDLVKQAAAKVHEAWCRGELSGFYKRFLAEREKGAKPVEALQNACNKNGKPRNEVVIDTDWLAKQSMEANKALETFEGFMDLVDCEVIVVKRFTTRNLTEREQKVAGEGNYKAETKEENILRPFEQLSADSQRENLEAAKGAANVYEEYAKRGFSIEQLSSPEIQEAIGTLIHADWMRRNERTEANKHLFVPYSELDDWTKQQDLDVFGALIEEVKKDEEKYEVKVEEGLMDLYPTAQEQAVLNKKDFERGYANWRDYTADRF